METIDQWVCDADYSMMCEYFGKEFPIKTIPNIFNRPCIICGVNANYLVDADENYIFSFVWRKK